MAPFVVVMFEGLEETFEVCCFEEFSSLDDFPFCYYCTMIVAFLELKRLTGAKGAYRSNFSGDFSMSLDGGEIELFLESFLYSFSVTFILC